MAYLFVEVIGLVIAPSSPVAGHWVLKYVGAAGLSLLCGGVGAAIVSAIRVWNALVRAGQSELAAEVKEHLWSVAMIVMGFVLCITALAIGLNP